MRCLGQLQAWVEAGETPLERERRYNSAPESMKPQIAGHLRTVARLKRRAELKKLTGE